MDNNIPKGCKPFDLQKAMAGEPVVTREGRPYKFGAYNPDANKGHELSGWVNGEVVANYSDNGRFYNDVEDNRDLFMAAKTQKVWVNLWRNFDDSIESCAFTIEELSEIHKNSKNRQFLKTIETEVEL